MTASEITEPSYLFGAFQLVPWRRLLRDGAQVALTPRALGVLSTLVERHDRIVTREEIFAEVWRDLAVEDHNLTMQHSVLRKILEPGTIATFPGRGYQFKAVVGWRPGAAPAQVAPVTNLPQSWAALIGRDLELAELAARLGRYKLVTIVGEGGVGKTRLATEVGWRQMTLFPDGVLLIDLAPLGDPALVASAVAPVLGVAVAGTEPPADAIATVIGQRRMLLILDNCEYLAGAVAALVQVLLGRAPGLSVLATSQEPLRLADEQVYRLNPLALPPPGAKGIAGYGAIDLFVSRAEAADRRFVLDDTNAYGVAEICRSLDGLPLALEMAASRLPLLGVGGLRARLDERLRLLGPGARIGDTRHRSLRAMVEWSYGLLDSTDQAVFRRLAIFPGSFSLDAAMAVAGAGETWPVVDALGRLVDKSLLTVEVGEPRRYRLLETLRLYATEQLTTSGESAATAERHARYVTALFDAAYATSDKGMMTDVEWIVLYRPEIDNVRAALDWALGSAERAPIVVALFGATGYLWYRLGLFGEGRRYAGRTIELIDQDIPSAVASRVLRSAGVLWGNTDRLSAVALLERSAAHLRTGADQRGLLSVLAMIGRHYTLLGRFAEAKVVLGEAQQITAIGDDKNYLTYLMLNRGDLALATNETVEAARYYTTGLELAREQKRSHLVNIFLNHLADAEFQQGRIDRAILYAKEAVEGLRAIGDRAALGWPLNNLASYLLMRGDHVEALGHAIEALSLFVAEGGSGLRNCLRRSALLGVLNGRSAVAAKLTGFVDAVQDRSGEVLEFTERQINDRLSMLLAVELSADDIAAHARDGAGWRERQAVDFALEFLIAAGSLPSEI
jgi:predicted ATPase/DNA-binding winged helix-turn-helix (wHTH) protein